MIGLNRIRLPPLRNTAVETRESTEDLRASRSSPLRDSAIIEDTHRPFWLASILIHAAYYITHERDVEEDQAYQQQLTQYGNYRRPTHGFIVLFTLAFEIYFLAVNPSQLASSIELGTQISNMGPPSVMIILP